MMFREREKSFGCLWYCWPFACVAHLSLGLIRFRPTLKGRVAEKIFHVLHLEIQKKNKANKPMETYKNAWSFIMFNLFPLLIKTAPTRRNNSVIWLKIYYISYARKAARSCCRKPRNWLCASPVQFFLLAHTTQSRPSSPSMKCGARKM